MKYITYTLLGLLCLITSPVWFPFAAAYLLGSNLIELWKERPKSQRQWDKRGE